MKVYNDYVTKAVKNSVKVEHYFELSPFNKQTDYPPMYIIIMHLHSIPMCDKSSSISIAMHRVLKTGYLYIQVMGQEVSLSTVAPLKMRTSSTNMTSHSYCPWQTRDPTQTALSSSCKLMDLLC